MSPSTTYLAWLLLLSALLAWIGVAFFAFSIVTTQGQYAAHLHTSQSASDQSLEAISQHALVIQTQSARNQLGALVAVDPASLATLIDAAGKTAGVDLQISNAVSSGAPVQGSGIATETFSFTVAAQGSFASVIYAASLLETLPVPSSVRQLQLIRAPMAPGSSASSGPWQLNAQINVVTDSTISS